MDRYKQTLIQYDIKGKKKLQSNLKRKESHVIVMFVPMTAVKNYEIQPLNARAYHRRRPPVR